VAVTPHAAGQSAYPDKLVRFIVPYGPGGAPDIVARLVTQQLSEKWKQPVIVENRAGAGGNIGTAAAAKAAPDGYTFLLGTVGPLTVAPAMTKDLPYDSLKDFVPLTNGVSVNNVLVVSAATSIHSVADLIASAKANPGRLNYGSSGPGATDHLAAEVFNGMANVNIVHVPFKGGNAVMVAILNGDVQLTFGTVPTAISHIRSGKLRALGVTGSRRLALLPELPTISQAGLQGYDVTTWYGFLAPAGTPAAIVAKVSQDIRDALKSPAVSEKLTAQGLEPWPTTPEEFGVRIREDLQRWASVVRKLGLSPN